MRPLIPLLLVAISCITQEIFASECDEQWLLFRNKFGKSYTDQGEHDRRKAIFCVNLQFIEKKNAASENGDAFGINHMADWTTSEVKSRFSAKSGSPVVKSITSDLHQLHKLNRLLMKDEGKLPELVDYRRDGRIVGPVKMQGDCGSCWSFATTGLIEANQHKWDPTIRSVIPLSEQQLIDCMDGDGCQGQYNKDALDYVGRVGGLMSAKDYPYISRKNTTMHECKFDESKIVNITRNYRDYKLYENAGEDILKKLVAKLGPILINAVLPENFHLAKTNIFIDSKCNDWDLNHAMLVVGYGYNQAGLDYWIVKNSWGRGWGDKGYGYIARNQNNMCGIATYPHFLI